MKAFLAITDPLWFERLRAHPELDEINFWHTTAGRHLKALAPGEPFLFKLRGEQAGILGGGFFTHATDVPFPLAWAAFGRGNGASDALDFERQVARRADADRAGGSISCTVLHSPFFFDEDDAIALPDDFSPSVSYGKVYELAEPRGRELWQRLCERLRPSAPLELLEPQPSMFGEPMLVHRRLGRGGFHLITIDVYERRCAITGEETLVALAPTHIRPVARGGAHRVDNGLLLRADLARLFALGFLTLDDQLRLVVTSALTEATGYAALAGVPARVPDEPVYRPAERFLAWHREHVFRG